MAEKTIPELDPIVSLEDYFVVPVDNTAETFKVTLANIGLYIRDTILPAGVMVPYGGAAAPSGWLLCDGSAVSRDTYLRLFTAIGVTFGPGDTTTTFNLPDMRGRVAAGKDDMGGATAGRLTNAGSGVVGTTLGAVGGSQNQSIAHTHSVTTNVSVSTQPTFTVDAHNHNIAHAHQWAHNVASGSEDTMYCKDDLDDTSTSIGTDRLTFMDRSMATAAGGNYRSNIELNSNKDLYTTGVLSPPSGSAGSTAASSAANVNTTTRTNNVALSNPSVTSAPMSANSTVVTVQPTLITNYIIKA